MIALRQANEVRSKRAKLKRQLREGGARLKEVQQHGYRAAIMIALAAEAIAVVTLAAYLATRRRSGAQGAESVSADRVAAGSRDRRTLGE
jgi:hypothetical protein